MRLVTSVSTLPIRVPRRIASLSVHTSPLHQPGTGDAGGLNVYVVELSKRLAERGIEVEIFTRAVSEIPRRWSSSSPGVLVRTSRRARPRARQGGPPGAALPLHPAVLRTEAGTGPAGTTSSTRTTGSPARSARPPRNAGAFRWCSPCTPWARSRTRRSRPATRRARGADPRRARGRRRRGPADRQHRRGGAAADRPVRRGPGQGADRQPRRGPERLPAGRPAGPGRKHGAGSGSRRTRWCCSSWAGCSRSRDPTSC